MDKYYGNDWREYKEAIKQDYPEYYHTLAWDEHPEGYDGPCFCATCRDYMASDA